MLHKKTHETFRYAKTSQVKIFLGTQINRYFVYEQIRAFLSVLYGLELKHIIELGLTFKTELVCAIFKNMIDVSWMLVG